MTDTKLKKVCELCEGQPAAVLCAECYKCYCDECSEFTHRKDPKKGHKVEVIPKGVRVDAMCPLHKNNPLTMLCLDNTKLCCSTCRYEGGHKDHRVANLLELSKDSRTFSVAKVRERFEVR